MFEIARVRYLWINELGHFGIFNSPIVTFHRLKFCLINPLRQQLGPKRHALDFDETGIGFPYLDIRKPHRFQLNVRSLIQVEQVKTRGVRAIRQYNSVGDSVMSLTE